MRTQSRLIKLLAVASLVPFGTFLAITPANSAVPQSAVLSVLHVASENKQTSKVDVYAGDMRIMRNLQLGQLLSVRITQGRYDITVFSGGGKPGKDEPLLKQSGVNLGRGSHTTFALHPNSDGVLTSSAFMNSALRNPDGRGRITVRHIAQAPAVDIQISEMTAFMNLSNQSEGSMHFPVGAKSIAVAQSNGQEVLVSPRVVTVNRPLNTIVYIWGSVEDGFRLALQRVPLKK